MLRHMLLAILAGASVGPAFAQEYAGPLAGFGFQLKWADSSLAELFGRIRTMPLGRPGSLERQEYLDILAYVLQKNEYPAGEKELTTETASGFGLSALGHRRRGDCANIPLSHESRRLRAFYATDWRLSTCD